MKLLPKARRGGRRDPAAARADARWRRRAMLADVECDLAGLADEQTYIESEITRSQDTAARLDSETAAAAADGCTGVARDLRAERMQTDAFLAELAEVRQAVTVERNRLLDLRKHLSGDSTSSGPPTPSRTRQPR